MYILNWLTNKNNRNNKIINESDNLIPKLDNLIIESDRSIKLKQQYNLDIDEIKIYDYSKLGFHIKGECYHYIGNDKKLYGNKYIFNNNIWSIINSNDTINLCLY